MQTQRLEAQVLDVVEKVVAGRRVEDDRVELKREWPTDFRKIARQIAGMANAAAGDPILWIIGLDDKAHSVFDVSEEIEPADWWNQVKTWFSEVAPDLSFLRVQTPHGAVAGLQMDTSRTPYLVTTDGRGGGEREVPWREGTSLRSAKRSEILRSVVAEAEAPALDPISGWVRASRTFVRPADPEHLLYASEDSVEIDYWVNAYVEAREAVRLPEYRWGLKFSVGGASFPLSVRSIRGPLEVVGQGKWSPIYGPAGSIAYVEGSGLHVNGSDTITIHGSTTVREGLDEVVQVLKRAQRVIVSARFPIALSTREAGFDATLYRSKRIDMERRSGANFRVFDDRCGEFTFGGATPWGYSGRSVKIVEDQAAT